ncbi:MAG TPA: GPW/gp25 family protein [Vicinamibacterales bacterium]|nr:GPW/gp25 family protein [Vicinamibacterales bacterium]
MADANAFLGRGWSFPVRVDDRDGAIRLSEYDQDIREAIWIILSTSKGERVMRPDFGCGIHDLVFEVINTTTLAEIEDTVRTALVIFEPRIDVVQVKALSNGGLDGQLRISIDYKIRGTNNQLNLVYPFYIKERG